MTIYKFMTMNMLTDGLYNFGDSRFKCRIQAINALIREKEPDVIGVQEMTEAMKPYMTEIFRKYQMVGESRGSILTDEYSAILFRADRFELKNTATYWLSRTPSKRRSRLLFSQFPRIVTCAVLYDQAEDKTFSMFNTHLDHNLEPVRSAQAEILCSLIQKYQKGSFTVVTGDFNAVVDSPPLRILEKCGLKDTVTEAIGSTLRGRIGSTIQHNRPIDHILISEHAELIRLEKLDQKYAGYYPSDHYPLLAEISD